MALQQLANDNPNGTRVTLGDNLAKINANTTEIDQRLTAAQQAASSALSTANAARPATAIVVTENVAPAPLSQYRVFKNEGNSAKTLTVQAGMGRFEVRRGEGFDISLIPAAGVTINGSTSTSPTVPGLMLTEVSAGVYEVEEDQQSDDVSIFEFMTRAQRRDVMSMAPTLDHSAAFQRAIDSGVGHIGLPGYVFRVKDLKVDNVKASFRLKSGPGGNPTKYPRLTVIGDATVGIFDMTGAAPFLYLERIDLWGAHAGTRLRGISIDDAADYAPSCLRLRDAFIRTFTGRGIHGGRYRSAVWIDNTLIEDNELEGIYLFSNQDWRITNCDVGRNGGDRVLVDDGPTVEVDNMVFDGYCSSHDLINTDLYFPPKRGLYIAGGAQIITVALGQVNNCGKDGIYINHNDAYPYADRAISLNGLQFVSNSMGAPGTYANIYTKAPLIAVTGCCHLKHPDSANVAKYGIQFSSVDATAIVSGGVWKDEYFTTGFTNIGSSVRVAKVVQTIDDRGIRVVNTADGTRAIMEVFKAGFSTNPKFTFNDLGQIRWGDGENATDTSLFRLSAGVLYTPQSFRIGAAAGYGNKLSFGSYNIWVDPASQRVRVKSSAPTSDADGLLLNGSDVTTLAAMLASSGTTGARREITDAVRAPMFAWDESRGKWVATAPFVLSRANAASTRTGDTSEYFIFTREVLGKLIGIHGSLRFETQWSCTDNANEKLLRFYLGATLLIDLDIANTAGASVVVTVANRATLATQRIELVATLSTGTVIRKVADTTADTAVTADLRASIDMAGGSDTTTLETSSVTILH